MSASPYLTSVEALAAIAGHARSESLSSESAAAVSRAAGSLLYRRLDIFADGFTPRDVQWAGLPGLDSPALASKAIAHLLERGAIVVRGRSAGMPHYGRTGAAVSDGPTHFRPTLPAQVGPRPETRTRPPSVNYVPARNKWRARGWRDGRRVLLGYFTTREEAAAAA